MSIRIFYEGTKFRLKSSRKACRLIEKVIKSEKRTLGDLNFIISNDQYILEINREFLKHNYFTDVIAFGGTSNRIVNGEIYISKDTVKRNSINYNVSLQEEMLRVLVHGVLHLVGYEDRDEVEKNIMHQKEDKWLRVFNSI